MKGFALVLLCAFVAVQARSSGVKTEEASPLAVLGESPWTVHLRSAIWTSGLLTTCAGSLIDASWVLTSATCVREARFVWIRYGVVRVINPELVTEASVIRIHPNFDQTVGSNDIALVGINRVVHSTANIVPVALESRSNIVAPSGQFCLFGANGNSPGEDLRCLSVSIDSMEAFGLVIATSNEGQATRFDIGAPLVANGVQVGILITPPGANDRNSGIFLRVNRYLDWLQAQTGINFDQVANPTPEIIG